MAVLQMYSHKCVSVCMLLGLHEGTTGRTRVVHLDILIMEPSGICQAPGWFCAGADFVLVLGVLGPQRVSLKFGGKNNATVLQGQLPLSDLRHTAKHSHPGDSMTVFHRLPQLSSPARRVNSWAIVDANVAETRANSRIVLSNTQSQKGCLHYLIVQEGLPRRILECRCKAELVCFGDCPFTMFFGHAHGDKSTEFPL